MFTGTTHSNYCSSISRINVLSTDSSSVENGYGNRQANTLRMIPKAQNCDLCRERRPVSDFSWRSLADWNCSGQVRLIRVWNRLVKPDRKRWFNGRKERENGTPLPDSLSGFILPVFWHGARSGIADFARRVYACAEAGLSALKYD